MSITSRVPSPRVSNGVRAWFSVLMLLMGAGQTLAQGLPEEVLRVLDQNEATYKSLPTYQVSYKGHAEHRDPSGTVVTRSDHEGVLEWTPDGVWIDGIWRYQAEKDSDGDLPPLLETEFALYRMKDGIAYWDIDQEHLVRVFPNEEADKKTGAATVYQQRVRNILGHSGFLDDQGRSIKEFLVSFVDENPVKCTHEVSDGILVLKIVPHHPVVGMIQIEHHYDMNRGGALVFVRTSDPVTGAPRVETKQFFSESAISYLPTRMEKKVYKRKGGYISDTEIVEYENLYLGTSGPISMDRFKRAENPSPEIAMLDPVAMIERGKTYPPGVRLPSGEIKLHPNDPGATYIPPRPPLPWYLDRYWQYGLYSGVFILGIGVVLKLCLRRRQ